MNFTNYVDFRAAVLRFIDGDDVSSGSVKTDTLDLMIAMGEQAVYYGMIGPQGEPLPGLRCAEMEAPLSITAADNKAAIPADCLELIRVQVAGEYPMDYTAEEGQLRKIKANGGSGASRKFSKQGLSLLFEPAIQDGTQVTGRYYQKAPDIATGALSAAFHRYPDVWLYASLAESAPFLGEDSRIALWKAQYKGRVMMANANDRLRMSSGSRLTQVSR